ncbi:MAG: recombinase family protein, partial [Desulfobacterales bacterium]|nr:recombinase family protein [Desulfobacterales bacterium]
MKPAEIKSKHRVVAYLRISTGDQDINAQRLELHEYARRNDLKID